MEESFEEASKRDEIMRIYNTTKDALRIIEEISRNTISDQLPQSMNYLRFAATCYFLIKI